VTLKELHDVTITIHIVFDLEKKWKEKDLESS